MLRNLMIRSGMVATCHNRKDDLYNQRIAADATDLVCILQQIFQFCNTI